MMEKKWLNEIVEPLLKWFRENARILPWREEPLPYYVWVSEIMLQQTRVEAVKPYFQRFIHALPEIEALANCPEEKLLKLWEGLGYYNRVRNMQKAAQIVMKQFSGQLPADYESLLSLPGIGSYTAGAIASIAYGIPVPAVDGNVLRVICRICELDDDITRQAVKKEIEHMVTEIEPADCPGLFNQALMELGAVVCVPNGVPDCEACPVSAFCLARIHGKTGEIPKKKPKQQRRIEEKTVLVVRDELHTVIRKRPAKGLLAGLYELPNLEGYLAEEEVLDYLKEKQLSPIRIQPLKASKHIFSHVEWHMIGYLILVEEMEPSESKSGFGKKDGIVPGKKDGPGEAQGIDRRQKECSGFLIVEPQQTEEEYPIPAAFAAYAGYLQIRVGQEKYQSEER